MPSKIWTILIALLIVVVVFFFIGLPLLFTLGAFNSHSLFTNSTCIAQAEYLCQNITYSTGYIKVNIGQDTGTNWNQVNIIAEGHNSTPYTNLPEQLFNTQSAVQIPGGLPNGQIVTVTIPVNKNSTTGIIWAQYTTNSTNYAEIASFALGSKNK